jgi:transposase
VTTERPTREQLIELAKSDPEAIADLVLMLWDRVDALEARLAQLERNSANSSKPPSSDRDSFNPPPKPKSLRKKSGRKPGGQAGHQGDTLRQIDDPERVVEHRLRAEAQCPRCGATIEESDEGPLLKGQCECRQVFELPAIRIEVTEHRAERRRCGRCGTQVSAAFPEGVNSPAQYGEGIQAAALYLGAHQLIPYQRLSEVFTDLFGCPLSSGTLANFVKRGGAKAGESMKPVRNALRLAKLAHADETGCRLHGKRHWLHVFSTAKLTSYHIDSKRGSEGMDRLGLLGGFAGSLVHDFLSSYYRFGCEHFLCAAHLLRELVYLHEEMDQPWAADMIALLREAKKLRDRDRNRPQGARRVIGEKTRLRIALRYCEIVLEGLALNPEPPPPPKGKRGRIKRGKALNLLIRLEERYEQIMGFFEYEHVPFDNNQAERDLRMMKTREKISGTFRSDQHAQAFCDLRSVISSARKQSRNLLDTLAELLTSPADLGDDLAHAGGT